MFASHILQGQSGTFLWLYLGPIKIQEQSVCVFFSVTSYYRYALLHSSLAAPSFITWVMISQINTHTKTLWIQYQTHGSNSLIFPWMWATWHRSYPQSYTTVANWATWYTLCQWYVCHLWHKVLMNDTGYHSYLDCCTSMANSGTWTILYKWHVPFFLLLLLLLLE